MMRRWAIVNILLGIGASLLGFEIVRTWARARPVVETEARPPTPVEARGESRRAEGAAPRAQQVPDALVAAVVEKDIFDPSRSPPAVEAVEVQAAPVTKAPDGVTIVGVRIFGEDREVFVSDTTQGSAVPRRLRTGDQVAGYTITAIEPNAVSLRSPSGDAVRMPLVPGKGSVVPAKPPTWMQYGPATSPARGYVGEPPAAGRQHRGGNRPKP